MKHASDVMPGKAAASSVPVHSSELHRQPWLLQEGAGPKGGPGGDVKLAWVQCSTPAHCHTIAP